MADASWKIFLRLLHLVPPLVIITAAHAANGLAWWNPSWQLTFVYWLFVVGLNVILMAVFAFLLARVAQADGGDVRLHPFRPRGLLIVTIAAAVMAASALGSWDPSLRTWLSFGGIAIGAGGLARFAFDQVER